MCDSGEGNLSSTTINTSNRDDTQSQYTYGYDYDEYEHIQQQQLEHIPQRVHDNLVPLTTITHTETETDVITEFEFENDPENTLLF